MFDLSAVDPKKLWPYGVVPYTIDEDDFPLGTKNRYYVEAALQYWNNQTFFKFVPKKSWHEDYLVITEHSSACFSYVGCQGGAQYIRCDIDTGKFDIASLMHELGHALGFDHEDHHKNWVKFLDAENQGISLNFVVNW